MTYNFRSLFLAAFLVLASVGQVFASSAISRNKPRLVVNIVVGQMRYDYLLRFANNFSEKGFHAMVREGSLCTRAMYDYALTRTGPGLATISTGVNPATHGIVGDRWFNYTTSEAIELALDKSSFTTGSDEYDGQYSPRNLLVSTIGDGLKAVSKESKVISVSLEPKSAVVVGGHTADAAYWLNARDGRWVTSNYYMTALPKWVDKLNNEEFALSYSNLKWEISKPLNSYHNDSYTDISVDSSKNGLSFDFLTRKKYDYDRIKTTPAGNTIVKDFAVQAMIYEGLGNDEATDILNIVFDASRNIGKMYGTGSIEIEDSYYCLDQDIAALLEFLDTHVGRERLLVVLSSDHGASDPVAEENRAPCGFFNGGQFTAIISGFLGAQLGPGEWVLKYENRQIYMNRRLLYEKGHNLEDIQTRVANFAIQFGGVSQAMTATALSNGRFSGGTLGRMQNSYFPRHSGDVIINLMPGWIDLDNSISDSGSPYNYDCHVPLIWYGGAIGNTDVTDDVNMTDVAPTVANIIGIAPPQASSGTPIAKVLKPLEVTAAHAQ